MTGDSTTYLILKVKIPDGYRSQSELDKDNEYLEEALRSAPKDVELNVCVSSTC